MADVLILVADVQLLANPPCSRGNNDDRGGRDGLEDLDQRLLIFTGDFTQIFIKRS